MIKYMMLFVLLLAAAAAEARSCRRSSFGRSYGGRGFHWQLPSANDMLADQVKRADLEKSLLVKRRELERIREEIEHEKRVKQLQRKLELRKYERMLKEQDKSPVN